MTKRNRFIDSEAVATNDGTDSELEQEFEDGFIEDSSSESEETNPAGPSTLQADSNSADDPFLALAERARLRETQPTLEIAREAVAPSPSDCPLWMVKIQRNKQYDFLLSFHAYCTDERDSPFYVASIFFQDHISDYVYIETANLRAPHWLSILGSMSMVRKSQGVPILQLVPFEDWLPTLSPELSKGMPQLGDWVLIGGGGIYSGDVGCVVRTGPKFSVVVVPRIPPEESGLGKRARPTRPMQCLASHPTNFQLLPPPDSYPKARRVRPWDARAWKDPQNRMFEEDLAVIQILPRKLTLARAVDSITRASFRLSSHPVVTESAPWNILRPSDWVFTRGEAVEVEDGELRHNGYVVNDEETTICIELEAESQTFNYPWPTITKVFAVGDAVEICGGPWDRTVGQVGSYNGVRVTILVNNEVPEDASNRRTIRSISSTEKREEAHEHEWMAETGLAKDSSDLFKAPFGTWWVLTIHANRLTRIAEVPTIPGSNPSTLAADPAVMRTPVFRSHRSHLPAPHVPQQPLVHTDHVIIIRGPHKGRIGSIVKMVDTEHLMVRLDSYGSTYAFNEIIVDRVFVQDKISNGVLRNHLSERNKMAHSSVVVPRRPSTPSPPRRNDSDPDSAWNPSAAGASSSTAPQMRDGLLAFGHPNFWMLDRRLEGVKIRAQLRSQTLWVRQVVEDNEPHFVRVHYKKEVRVHPQDLSFVHPETTHFCRFLVIRGEYTGRHVRAVAYEQCRPGSVKGRIKWRVRLVKEVIPAEEDDMDEYVIALYDKDMVLGWEPKEDTVANRIISRQLRQ